MAVVHILNSGSDWRLEVLSFCQRFHAPAGHTQGGNSIKNDGGSANGRLGSRQLIQISSVGNTGLHVECN